MNFKTIFQIILFLPYSIANNYDLHICRDTLLLGVKKCDDSDFKCKSTPYSNDYTLENDNIVFSSVIKKEDVPQELDAKKFLMNKVGYINNRTPRQNPDTDCPYQITVVLAKDYSNCINSHEYSRVDEFYDRVLKTYRIISNITNNGLVVKEEDVLYKEYKKNNPEDKTGVLYKLPEQPLKVSVMQNEHRGARGMSSQFFLSLNPDMEITDRIVAHEVMHSLNFMHPFDPTLATYTYTKTTYDDNNATLTETSSFYRFQSSWSGLQSNATFNRYSQYELNVVLSYAHHYADEISYNDYLMVLEAIKIQSLLPEGKLQAFENLINEYKVALKNGLTFFDIADIQMLYGRDPYAVKKQMEAIGVEFFIFKSARPLLQAGQERETFIVNEAAKIEIKALHTGIGEGTYDTRYVFYPNTTNPVLHKQNEENVTKMKNDFYQRYLKDIFTNKKTSVASCFLFVAFYLLRRQKSTDRVLASESRSAIEMMDLNTTRQENLQLSQSLLLLQSLPGQESNSDTRLNIDTKQGKINDICTEERKEVMDRPAEYCL